jgi:hypothetical protein
MRQLRSCSHPIAPNAAQSRSPLQTPPLEQRRSAAAIVLVMPANAGIQYSFDKALDSRVRGNDNIVGYDSI